MVSGANVTDVTSDSNEDPASATQRLFNTLLITFAAVFLGFAVIRLKLVFPEKGEMKGFGFFIGQIVFPLLIFKTVATARLGAVDWGVLIACTLGKISVMFVTWVITFCFFQSRARSGQRFLNATVFASFVMASNDFAIGFPVVQALYGSKADMGIYIAGNSLVGSLFFVPSIMVLFSIGSALKKNDEGGNDAAQESTLRTALAIGQNIIFNPVILMTILGLIYKATLGFTLTDDGHQLKFPSPLSDAIQLVTAPFGMCALFLTGTSLKSLRLDLVSTLLVIMKVVVCAYITYLFAKIFTGQSMLQNFSFLYGMIPTSSAPLIFASSFSPESSELLATAILMGLILAGPMMYGSALFLEAPLMDMTHVVAQVHFTASAIGVGIGVVFLLVLSVLGHEWSYKCGVKALVAIFGISLCTYTLFVFTMSPQIGLDWCSEYNQHQGWTAIGIVACWLQNSNVILIFAMHLAATMARGKQVNDSSNSFRLVLPVVAACLAVALIPGFFAYPNTINEMCAVVNPELGPITLWPNLVWTTTSLTISIGLYLYDRAVKKESRAGNQSINLRPSEDEVSNSSSPSLSSRNGDQDASAEPGWKSLVPFGIVKGLFIVQTLRLVIQFVNTIMVMQATQIRGSFAQMLVIENLIMESQPLVFVALLLGNAVFGAHVTEVVRRRLGLGKTDSTPAARFISGASIIGGNPIGGAPSDRLVEDLGVSRKSGGFHTSAGLSESESSSSDE